MVDPREGAGRRPTEDDLGLWKRQADFTDEDRLAVGILRRHAAAASDECLLWLVQLVSRPHLLEEELDLQRRVGRIPHDRPVLSELRSRHGFANELVALVAAGGVAQPGFGRSTASDPAVPRVRPGNVDVGQSVRQLGLCLVRGGVWLGIWLLLLTLARRWS